MLVWIIESQNGATSVCLQKKKKKNEKRKKCESLGSDLRGRQHAKMGGLCIATERLLDQESIPTKQQGSKNRPPSGHLRLKNPVWRVKKSF